MGLIEVIHYEKANNNKTIGYVDIKVEIAKPTTFILRKIAHVQIGDRKFFNLPTFRRDEGNNHNYLKYFKFENDSYDTRLLSSLTQKVEEYCKKNGIVDPMGYLSQMDEIPF